MPYLQRGHSAELAYHPYRVMPPSTHAGRLRPVAAPQELGAGQADELFRSRRFVALLVPLSSVVIASLLIAPAGTGSGPLIIVAVVVAHIAKVPA
jgi:hypothetical protein